MWQSYSNGLLVAFGLIMAIGAQNAFVLAQSLRREHHLPAAALCDEAGRFRPAAELRALFEARGIDGERPVIAYCGGGIAATGDAFALTALLGREAVRVYDASLQEWAADTSLPMAVGVG